MIKKVLLIAMAVTSMCEPSLSLTLDFGVHAEAGFDAATREFVNTLPNTWRPQIARIVEDTLNRTDKSVANYLAAVDKLISRKLQETQCAVVGTQKQIVDDLIQRFPWVTKVGPMEDLRNHIREQEARRDPSKPPTFIKDLYNDLSLKTSIVSCQNFAVLTARADAKKIVDDYSARWFVWNRLDSIKCKDSIECLAAYRVIVQTAIEQADKRDVENAGVTRALTRLAEPRQTSWWSEANNFNEYERAFSQLFYIENMLGSARVLREASAMKKIASADVEISSLRNEIEASRGMQIPGPMQHISDHSPMGINILIPSFVTAFSNTFYCQQNFVGFITPKLAHFVRRIENVDGALSEARAEAPVLSANIVQSKNAVETLRRRISSKEGFCS